jgi:Enoyl-CoA hydratase/isomerase
VQAGMLLVSPPFPDPDSCGAQLTVALARSNVPAGERQRFGRNYFKNEYTLDYYIATYPKPMIAIMDGITSKCPLIPRSFASWDLKRLMDSGRRSRLEYQYALQSRD